MDKAGKYRDHYDVIVVGAGAAGIGASLASARNGARTLLVERYGFIGGTTTASLVNAIDGIRITGIQGIAKEIRDGLLRTGIMNEKPLLDKTLPYAFFEDQGGVNTAEYKIAVTRMLQDAGVDFLFHSWVSGVYVNYQGISSISVLNKSGTQELRARNYVDATGDADLAYFSGAPCEMGDEKGQLQSPTLCFDVGGIDEDQLISYATEHPDDFGVHPRFGRLKRNPNNSAGWTGGISIIEKRSKSIEFAFPEFGIGLCRLAERGNAHLNITRINHVNGTDVYDLSYAELEGLRQIKDSFRFLKEHMPGFQSAYLARIAAQVGIRETRRIRARYMLSIDDVRAGRRFDDSVLSWTWGHADIHSPDDNRWDIEVIEGPYSIPFRSLLPQGINNLIVAGRCIGTDRLVNGTTRSQPICMSTGQVAGIAASISSLSGDDLSRVDVGILQSVLTDRNVKW